VGAERRLRQPYSIVRKIPYLIEIRIEARVRDVGAGTEAASEPLPAAGNWRGRLVKRQARYFGEACDGVVGGACVGAVGGAVAGPCVGAAPVDGPCDGLDGPSVGAEPVDGTDCVCVSRMSSFNLAERSSNSLSRRSLATSSTTGLFAVMCL
jgi:hypothetical protein